MPSVIGYHHVTDRDHWLHDAEPRRAPRGGAGVAHTITSTL